MANKKLFKSKTNFSIRRLHQSGSFGNIYERDYTTIVNSLDNPGSQIPILGSPTFKLSVSNGYNKKKKYSYGDWLSKNNGDELTYEWTLSNLEIKDDKNNNILNTFSKKLTDFACYGSSTELIRSTLTNIVAKFPAELYVTDNQYNGYNIIDNPMFIDIIRDSIPDDSYVSELRYLRKSFNKYEIISGRIKYDIENIEVVSEESKDCLTNGDLIATVKIKSDIEINIDCYYMNGEILYLTEDNLNIHIRPKIEYIENFFNNLDDFEKIILNRETNYTCTFETYYEDDEGGWQMSEKTYKWPKGNGSWNLAINGMDYSLYIEELTKLGNVYDELFTNSIQRDMTHESINNMDMTGGIVIEDDEYKYNSTKMSKILNVVGRQFDEIKKYIDNIKCSNNITYTKEQNLPDYFLTDSLNTSGWEVHEILTWADGVTHKEVVDINNEFMRRLKLNTKSIFSKKGTKQCIEELLSIFGYRSTDWIKKNNYNSLPDNESLKTCYILKEFSYVTNGYGFNDGNLSHEEVTLNVKKFNQLKDSYSIDDINGVSTVNDPFQGLPVAELYVSGSTSILVPWFDKNKTYDGDIYFQMKGGWAKNDGTGTTETSVYGYSLSKIHHAQTQQELYNIPYRLIDENGIYYVEKVNKYFKIKNLEQHKTKDGWDEVGENEYSTYLNIIDNNKGNNPHTGEYDDGVTYLRSYGQLFINSTFNNTKSNIIKDNLKYGFNIELIEDSRKCYYFNDNYNGENNNTNTQLRTINNKSYNLFLNTSASTFDEISSFSVINSKEFHITFDITFREFIEKDIIPYLLQVIPSTTIFSYNFEKITPNSKAFNAEIEQIVCNGNICRIKNIA